MIELLKKAIDKASDLPEDAQEILAQELMAEIEWETQWDKTLSESQDVLDKMTEKAMKEYESGRTKEMGFDEL